MDKKKLSNVSDLLILGILFNMLLDNFLFSAHGGKEKNLYGTNGKREKKTDN